MRIIHTDSINPFSLRGFDRDMVYNGLDVCVTHEILSPMLAELHPDTAAVYEFERALQGPVTEMRIRGCLVDQVRVYDVTERLWETLDRLERDVTRIAVDGCGMPGSFNWRSGPDLQKLFYEVLGLPVQRRNGRPTVDDHARETLAIYPMATQIIKHINAMAIIAKRLSVLKTEIDDDGRIRTSYNIAGTNTGRFSSSLSEFGTGGNLQNLEEYLRSILIADKGYKFAKFDAKSGESFCVGAIEWNLFADPTYLNACESGDPHTAVARLVWPDLPWTGDPKLDKKLAETPFHRHYTYRFMCKKIGHGSNYGGKPLRLSEEAELPVHIITEFQPKYFTVFPAHQRWHGWVANELKTKGSLISLTGRRRSFFKRRTDPKTLNEAIAFNPQGSLADIVNQALLKLWRLRICPIVFQDHDALTFMYPEAEEDRIIPILQRELTIPIQLEGGRVLRIPYDCEVGWNKGHYCCGERRPECKGCTHEPNPDGLREYNGHDPRRRQPQVGLLDRIIHRGDSKPRFAPNISALDGDLGPGSDALAEGMASDIE